MILQFSWHWKFLKIDTWLFDIDWHFFCVLAFSKKTTKNGPKIENITVCKDNTKLYQQDPNKGSFFSFSKKCFLPSKKTEFDFSKEQLTHFSISIFVFKNVFRQKKRRNIAGENKTRAETCGKNNGRNLAQKKEGRT